MIATVRAKSRGHARVRGARTPVLRATLAVSLCSLVAAASPAIQRARAEQPTVDPAHALASKFAADADRAAQRAKAAEAAAREAEARRAVAARRAEESRRTAEAARRDAERRKSDEAEMLERARAEVEARRSEERRVRSERAAAEAEKTAAERAAASERQRAEAALRAADEEKAAAARRLAAQKEDEARRRAAFAERARLEEERIDRETAAAAARAEAERATAAQAAAAAERTAAREAATAKAAEDRLIEEAKRAEAARLAMEAEREAENAALATQLRRIEDMHAAEHAPKVPPSSPGATARADTPSPPGVQPNERSDAPSAGARSAAVSDPPAADHANGDPVGEASRDAGGVIRPRSHVPTGAVPPAPGSAPAAGSATASASPVTRVTVLLVMEPGDRGIRRYNKTADPVLCMADACYVSKGPDTDAWRAPRMRALGSLNTLGGRADACNQSLGCVFRNVDLRGAQANLQPIDLRLLRHDRRSPSAVAADPSCIANAGRLVCAATVDGGSYRMWVVPEAVAEAAGPDALLAAIRGGLVAATGPQPAARLQ